MTISRHLFLCAAVGAVGFLGGCAGPVPLTERPGSDVAVARFFLDVDGLEADFPDEGGGLAPTIARVVQDGKDVARAAETLAHPEGSVVKAVTDSVYAAFAAGLAAEHGLRVLPIDALRGEVPYLVGAPMGQAGRVARSGAHGGVLEVDVSVEVPDAGQGHWSFLGTGRARVQGRPEMTLAVRMVGADGHVLWRDRVRVRSREKVTLDERWVLGFRTDREVSDASSLPGLMREAVTRLAQRGGRTS